MDVLGVHVYGLLSTQFDSEHRWLLTLDTERPNSFTALDGHFRVTTIVINHHC